MRFSGNLDTVNGVTSATSGALFNQQKSPLFGAIQRVYCIV
jgi:hypothetical protein